MEINTVNPESHVFTEKLVNIAKPPNRLCYMGTLPALGAPVVAIVGTRKPSTYGREVTEMLARDLARSGVIILSGLALGVDCIAQRAALDVGGTVIAVVTNQLPDISPRSNQTLANSIIAEGGAVISEWMEGDGKTIGKWSFLERNRLVSGLADAVIVTEAAERSGTLNTAAHALEQGRELFIVPGNITSPLSAGCNNLLKQGALVATKASDVLEVVAPQLLKTSTTQTPLPIGQTPAETTVLQLLHKGLRDGDQLHQQSLLSAADFATTLTMLEIHGAIKPLGANQWTLG